MAGKVRNMRSEKRAGDNSVKGLKDRFGGLGIQEMPFIFNLNNHGS